MTFRAPRGRGRITSHQTERSLFSNWLFLTAVEHRTNPGLGEDAFVSRNWADSVSSPYVQECPTYRASSTMSEPPPPILTQLLLLVILQEYADPRLLRCRTGRGEMGGWAASEVLAALLTIWRSSFLTLVAWP